MTHTHALAHRSSRGETTESGRGSTTRETGMKERNRSMGMYASVWGEARCHQTVTHHDQCPAGGTARARGLRLRPCGPVSPADRPTTGAAVPVATPAGRRHHPPAGVAHATRLAPRARPEPGIQVLACCLAARLEWADAPLPLDWEALSPPARWGARPPPWRPQVPMRSACTLTSSPRRAVS